MEEDFARVREEGRGGGEERERESDEERGRKSETEGKCAREWVVERDGD